MDSAYSSRRRHPILRICTVILLLLLLAGGIWAYHAGLFTGSSSTLEFENLDSLPWNLILVNQDHAIPDNWSQELTTLSNGTQVDSRIYPELQQMFDDMRAQGVYPVVASGYRSAEKQQSLMDDKIKEFIDQGESAAQAKKDAKKWVNPVGYSEHQTGLAVDINADGVNSTGEEVYTWLKEHAWEYGFILRYPDGKTKFTGTDYEPWHYRYVGKDAAKVIPVFGPISGAAGAEPVPAPGGSGAPLWKKRSGNTAGKTAGHCSLSYPPIEKAVLAPKHSHCRAECPVHSSGRRLGQLGPPPSPGKHPAGFRRHHRRLHLLPHL